MFINAKEQKPAEFLKGETLRCLLGAGVEYSPQTQVLTGTIAVETIGWAGTGGLNISSGFIPICQ